MVLLINRLKRKRKVIINLHPLCLVKNKISNKGIHVLTSFGSSYSFLMKSRAFDLLSLSFILLSGGAPLPP